MSTSRLVTKIKKPIAKITPYVKDGEEKKPLHSYETSFDFNEQFQQERFTHFSDTYHSAGISGSTYANAKATKIESTLDASEMRYLIDEDGVRIGFTMATADGLGHGFDEQENAQIAGAAITVCEQFNESVQDLALSENNIKEKIISAGTFAKNSFVPHKNTQVSLQGSEASLAITVVRRDKKDGALHCVLGNVGDGMIVVIDGAAQQIKKIIGARVYARESWGGKIEYNPMSAQRATAATIEYKKIELKDNDLVIHMTDGVWSELSLLPDTIQAMEEKKPLYKESLLKKDDFDEILKEKKEVSAYELSSTILNSAIQNTLSQRQKFNDLKKNLTNHFDLFKKKQFSSEREFNSYTLETWLTECVESGYEDLTSNVNEYLSLADHDGVNYSQGLKTPAGIFISDLGKKSFGDCATVCVMQAPDREVELVRALIEYPQNASTLVTRLQAIIPEEKSADHEAWKTRIIQKLSAEEYIVRQENAPGCRYHEIQRKHTYKDDQIRLVDKIIDFTIGVKNKEKTRKEAQATLTKQDQQQVLVDLLERKQNPLSLKEANDLFVFFKNIKQLNEHRNPYRDWFFGLNNTASWRTMVGSIREKALTKLLTEMYKIEDKNDKIAFLETARNMAIFSDHRNNSVFVGAFGRTHAVIVIDQHLDNLRQPGKNQVTVVPL